MDVARTVVSIMGLEDKETKDNSQKANMRKVMRIFAKTPVALAAFYRARKGKKIIPPKKNLSFSVSDNILQIMSYSFRNTKVFCCIWRIFQP